MTLIISLTSPSYVLQVTDRLLTQNQSPFDQHANKNILFVARNAIVTMGYTGIAFLGDVPTDQWIVEKLTGVKFDPSRPPPVMSTGTRRFFPDIGRSLHILKEALDSARSEIQSGWRRNWTAGSFDVSITGWQWNKKGRFRPISAWLSKSCDNDTVEVGYSPRHLFARGFRVSVAPSENMSLSDLRHLSDRVRSKMPDEAEALFVERVRQVSSRVAEVGPNCMSIILLSPSIAQGRIRYMPVAPGRAVISTPSLIQELAVAVSPWIIGSNVIMAPSIMSGSGWQVQLDRYTISFDATDNPRFRGILFGQSRPRMP